MAVGPASQLEQLDRLGRGLDSSHQFRQRDDLDIDRDTQQNTSMKLPFPDLFVRLFVSELSATDNVREGDGFGFVV